MLSPLFKKKKRSNFFKESHVTHLPLISPPHTTNSQISLLIWPVNQGTFTSFFPFHSPHKHSSLTLPYSPTSTTPHHFHHHFLARSLQNSIGKRFFWRVKLFEGCSVSSFLMRYFWKITMLHKALFLG